MCTVASQSLVLRLAACSQRSWGPLLLLYLTSAECDREFASGLQYVLHDSQPPHLFVIRKLQKTGAQNDSNLSLYYVLDGSIYQAPTLHTAFQSRMV